MLPRRVTKARPVSVHASIRQDIRKYTMKATIEHLLAKAHSIIAIRDQAELYHCLRLGSQPLDNITIFPTDVIEALTVECTVVFTVNT